MHGSNGKHEMNGSMEEAWRKHTLYNNLIAMASKKEINLCYTTYRVFADVLWS